MSKRRFQPLHFAGSGTDLLRILRMRRHVLAEVMRGGRAVSVRGMPLTIHDF